MKDVESMILTEALVRLFLSVWVLIFFISKTQDVNAAPCYKGVIGPWTCSPCGLGTRCAFCRWCLGYCYNQRSFQNDERATYGEAVVQFKQPYIDVFEDLKKLLTDDEISQIDVVGIYKVTHFALREDCILCTNIPEMEEFRDKTREIYQKLRHMMKSENITIDDIEIPSRTSKRLSEKFRNAALKNTLKALEAAQKIPANVTAKVDYNSSIAISANITATISSTMTSTIISPKTSTIMSTLTSTITSTTSATTGDQKDFF